MNNISHEEIKAARKRHQCSWCDEHIDAGQPYVRQLSKDGSEVYVWKAHPECYKAVCSLDSMKIEYEVGVTYARGCTLDRFEPCDCPGHQRIRDGGRG